MDESPHMPRTFDDWVHLAATDPDGFERMRRRTIEQHIRRAPPHRQERLRRLQWRVDTTRRRARTPMGACLSLSAMMWESLLGRHGLLEAMRGDAAKPLPRARVLPFRGGN